MINLRYPENSGIGGDPRVGRKELHVGQDDDILVMGTIQGRVRTAWNKPRNIENIPIRIEQVQEASRDT